MWGEEDFTEAGNRPPIFQYRTRLFSNQTLGRLLHCHARGNPPLHNCATIRSGFDTKDGKRSFDCETGSCYIGKAYIIHSSSRSYCLSIDSFSVKSIPKAQFKSFEKRNHDYDLFGTLFAQIIFVNFQNCGTASYCMNSS